MSFPSHCNRAPENPENQKMIYDILSAIGIYPICGRCLETCVIEVSIVDALLKSVDKCCGSIGSPSPFVFHLYFAR
jgi:hypothetical protein